MAKTTYDLSQIHRALGMRSQLALPNVDPTDLDQVIIVGDMSTSFGAQQFEARGFGSGRVLATVGEIGRFELLSNSPGGIVIERLSGLAGLSGAPGQFVFFDIRAPRAFDTQGLPAQSLNVGGTAFTSAFNQGSNIFPSGSRVLVPLPPDGFFTFEDLGWFVRSGLAFNVDAEIVNLEMSLSVQWREIPQSAGSA